MTSLLPSGCLRTFVVGLGPFSSSQRQFKIGGAFSSEWWTSTALVILLANISSAIFAKVLANLGLDVGNRTFVDDRYIWIRCVVALRRSLEHVRVYDTRCKSRLNPDKTKVLATSRGIPT